MANIFNSSPNVLAIPSCVDRGEYRRWKLVQGPVSASLLVLFLLQESAAARLLQIVWKGRPRLLSRLYLLDQRFVQCSASAMVAVESFSARSAR